MSIRCKEQIINSDDISNSSTRTDQFPGPLEFEIRLRYVERQYSNCSSFQGSHSPSFGHARKLFSTAHPVCVPQTFHQTAPLTHFGPSIMLITDNGAIRPRTLPTNGSDRTSSKSSGLTCASRPTASLSDTQAFGSLPLLLPVLLGLGVAEIDPVGLFLLQFRFGSGQRITH